MSAKAKPRPAPTDAERIAELEYQAAALSKENSELNDRQSRQARAGSEIEKHHNRIRTERAIEAVRARLRSPYVEQNLPTVHRILDRLNAGTAPKDAANWLDLADATDELSRAKVEALATGELVRAALDRVASASRQDRQSWIDQASDDLRALWHLPATTQTGNQE